MSGTWMETQYSRSKPTNRCLKSSEVREIPAKRTFHNVINANCSKNVLKVQFPYLTLLCNCEKNAFQRFCSADDFKACNGCCTFSCTSIESSSNEQTWIVSLKGLAMLLVTIPGCRLPYRNLMPNSGCST